MWSQTVRLRNMTSIYIFNQAKVLLLLRKNSQVGAPSWRGIGGHFKPAELDDPLQCVMRELYEETGLQEDDLQLVRLKYITMRYTQGEIRQNYWYFAEIRDVDFALAECDEGVLAWVALEELDALDMPFTARACWQHYLSMANKPNAMYGGIATAQGVQFVELGGF